MISVELLRERVRADRDRDEALDTCMEAFAVIEYLCAEYARDESDLFPTWMSAIAPACSGRCALGGPLPLDPGAEAAEVFLDRTGEDEMAGQLAALAAAVRDRLQELAGEMVDAPLRLACERGIAAAEEICLLLGADG
jgi:hypothetical protein